MTLLPLLLAAAMPARQPLPPPPPDPDAQAAQVSAWLFAGEPPIDVCQRAAARGLPGDPELAESWRVRARAAALVPQLSAEYRHDERGRWYGVGSDDLLRSAPADTFSVRATWTLAHLVFTPEEPRAVTAAAELSRRRQERVERVTRLYFHRRRLRLSLALSPPDEPRARAELAVEIDEVTAELDALTGGLFSGRGEGS
ncbi:hypothetical protein [Anaeromyxobacter paludicola]|uniref:Uncharacterized protein n=1 Tax=Anaeromyxobacter paludicola TaxID=2918171 RepID=A0ABM7XB13_9BACT|nr:hypothetical protein [Anaeromyxobacter paludicola]BDG09053.1 hypothetical protein AMPC_21660 [Anaeromyxobacter paludicola]